MKWKSVLSNKRSEGIVEGIAIAYVLLFIYAATSKLLDFETFSVQLAQSPLLSAYAGIIAWLVPGIELAIAVLLTLKRFRTSALYAAFTLMVMFTAYIFIILNFSDFIPCSCGGVLEKLSWTQHLIFNVVFILLAGIAVFLLRHSNNKMKLLLLATLVIIGISIIALLFAFSEKQIHRNNAFQRRYVPHPIKELSSIDLKYDSYYIAGVSDSIIYLGNVTAPLNIIELGISLRSKRYKKIHLEVMELPYKNIQINVISPQFYVSDGTVPIVFKGDIEDWNAKVIMKDKVYFALFSPLDSTQFILRTIDGQTRENTIAKYYYGQKTLIKNKELLQKQGDGIFDTDGQLLLNRKLEKFIYIYFYRNEFMIFDKDLKLEYRGTTIDTISQSQLEISHLNSSNQDKLNPNAIVVNRQTTTDGNYLFINSDRLGKYEDAENLHRATIIDVYNIDLKEYSFSFYIYNYKNSKVSSFRIKDNLLITIMGNYLITYQLNDKYFKTKK